MTDIEPGILLLQLFGLFLVVGLFIGFCDRCFMQARGPFLLQQIGRIFCGTFRRAMIAYGLLVTVITAILTLLLLWPFLTGIVVGETIWYDEFVVIMSAATLTLPSLLWTTYYRLSRRFQREPVSDRKRMWDTARSGAIIDAVEIAFRKSSPDKTEFRELVYRLLEAHQKINPGKTRKLYTKAFEQLLARNDECGNAFREFYEEWYAIGLQNGS